MTKNDDFSGTWTLCYWYPSNNHGGDDPSEYLMKATQKGDKIVMESLPNDINAYMLANLWLDGDQVTGTWHETTSPGGEFKGMTYSGAGQLVLDRQSRTMEGHWAGIGLNRETNLPQTYTGKWEIRWTPSSKSED